MRLQLIEGILLVFGNELWAIDGQLLVGIHGDHNIPNIGLEPKKEKEMSRSEGQGQREWEHVNSLATHPQSRAPIYTHINLFVFIAQLEVLEQRLLLQGFQEHKVLHPHGIFP